MSETTISSFVLRFVQEQSDDAAPAHDAWHGIISHVQSNVQLRFTRIEEALSFMSDYVPLTGSQQTEKEIPTDDNS